MKKDLAIISVLLIIISFLALVLHTITTAPGETKIIYDTTIDGLNNHIDDDVTLEVGGLLIYGYEAYYEGEETIQAEGYTIKVDDLIPVSRDYVGYYTTHNNTIYLFGFEGVIPGGFDGPITVTGTARKLFDEWGEEQGIFVEVAEWRYV